MQQILPPWLLTNKQTIANKKCKIVVSGKEKQTKEMHYKYFPLKIIIPSSMCIGFQKGEKLEGKVESPLGQHQRQDTFQCS